MYCLLLFALVVCSGAKGGGFWDAPMDIPTSSSKGPDPEETEKIPLEPELSGVLLEKGQHDPEQIEINLTPETENEEENSDPECFNKNCGPCRCCYKLREIRAKCTTNITNIPTNLPWNITHLTLHGTDISRIRAKETEYGFRISQFSIYTRLVRIELLNNLKLSQVDVDAFNFDRLIVDDNSLKWLFIDGSPELKEIPDGAFGYFHVLSHIKIVYCGLTRPPLWKSDAFYDGTNAIHIMTKMDFSHNNIAEIPEKTFQVANEIKINEIDLSNNNIVKLKSGTFENALEIGQLELQNNLLEKVDGYVFNNSRIKTLILSDNTRLVALDEFAFKGAHIDLLDLSKTAITQLPTEGLHMLKNLTIENTYTLQIFPSVFKMGQMVGAKLTYSQHCCAFLFPDKQNRTEFNIFKRQVDRDCTTLSPSLSTTFQYNSDGIPLKSTRRRLLSPTGRRLARRKKRNDATGQAFGTFHQDSSANVSTDWSFDYDDAFYDNYDADSYDGFGAPINFWTEEEDSDAYQADFPKIDEDEFDDNNFHTSTLNPHSTYTQTMRCGQLQEHIRNVECVPRPDDFNPCQDVLGLTWLRIVAWFVVITAELGNLCVIIVTLCSKYRFTDLTITKFLICNLAFADLTLGIYLLVLAAYDLCSKGQYFTSALIWQYQGGCQAAGFLATFSTCLSTFTLTVITMERWYSISYVMNPDKRIKLRHAAVIMAGSWTFSLIMAILPLVGVSSYSKTSICLPMETTRLVDKGYIIALMLVNATCFVVICFCYIDMYCKVRSNGTSPSVGRTDAKIAKRMALLVFTDFVCLFPIVFFGLTAAFGKPLIDVKESKILLVFFFPLNACANPYLYVITTKHFRRDFISMLSRCGFCEKKAAEYRLEMTSFPMSMSHSRNSISGATHHLVHRPSAGSNQTYMTYVRSNNKGSKASLSNITDKSSSPNTTPQTTPNEYDRNKQRGLADITSYHDDDLFLPAQEDTRTTFSRTSDNGQQFDGTNLMSKANNGQCCLEESQKNNISNPCSRVRSVSEYSVKSFLNVAKNNEKQVTDQIMHTNSGTTFATLSDGPVRHLPPRTQKKSIPGDSGYGEGDDILPSDVTPVIDNEEVFSYSTSLDTSICPLSEFTRKSASVLN